MSGIQKAGSAPLNYTASKAPARTASEGTESRSTEPADRVTLGSDQEIYNRPSTRQVYQALHSLQHPEPPRELSAAEKSKALQGLSKMLLEDYTRSGRDLGSH